MSSSRLLFEVCWEVCNMVGGIHTVLSTRVNQVRHQYGEDGYIAIGPDIARGEGEASEFRPEVWDAELASSLRDHEVGVRMGRWLVPGEPRCLLLNHSRLYDRKDLILGRYWEQFELDSLFGGWDYYDPVLFGHAAGQVIQHIRDRFLLPRRRSAVVQAHEWMAAASLLHLKSAAPDIGTVFTTHATMLGRSLAGSSADPNFYQSLADVDAASTASRLNVSSKHSMECVAAREADVFTTVSEITALECTHLLGRTPDPILPNGLGSKPVHERKRESAREDLFELAELTTGDRYDRNNTLLFVLAGRYEYVNKGVDAYLDALDTLASELKDKNDKRVVAFAMLPAGHAEPKRELWDRAQGRKAVTPLRCTHDLLDEANDPIRRQLDALDVRNEEGATVHIVHVPIYLDGSDPLIRQKYWDLLPGADLGVFPSFYEPWGYTPLEAIAFGVPAVTTDRAGFGRWVRQNGEYHQTGVRVVQREGRPYGAFVEDLCAAMDQFIALDAEKRERLRKCALHTAAATDWTHFVQHYLEAHEKAAKAAELRRKKLSLTQLELGAVATSPTEGSGLIELPRPEAGEPRAPYSRSFNVVNAAPEALQPLQSLAANLWWRWHPDATALFEQIDPELFGQVDQNPHALLDQVDPARLFALADDGEYVSELHRVHAQMCEGTKTKKPRIAYFCMEFGVASFLKLYSGGLGVLAGDHLKAASDMGLPLCAVGLAYKDGYFRQLVDRAGQQEASDDRNEFASSPFEPVLQGPKTPLQIDVPMPAGALSVRAWKLQVGRIPLYLLDTDVPENRPEDRAICDRLYGGDSAHRLRQEIVLGMGGHRLLMELGIEPDVFHMNEGHSAFLIFARAAKLIQRDGLRSQEAFELIRNTTVFTTHTPVAAGHDRFPETMVRPHLSRLEHELRLDWPRIMAMSSTGEGSGSLELDTTALAAKASGYVNGVSEKHGAVSREMFLPFYPSLEDPDDVPCSSVTNGVHVPSWLAAPWQRLIEREMGPDWREHLADVERFRWLREHDPKEIWAIHRELRAELLDWLRAHLTESWTRRHEDLGFLQDSIAGLDEARMLVGFARRFAPYKRADLLLSEPERLVQLLESQPGVTLIYAGKAHPADGRGQELLRRVYETTKNPALAGRVIFVENYDIDVARRLVAGCDVWLNTPTRPLEASGTSGMKAAMNGCLNLSVDDGWWREGYEGDNGWLIELPARSLHDPSAADRATTMAMLEGEILPCYASRDQDGVPLRWIERMRASMASIIPRFSSRRMVGEYADRFYRPAMQDAERLRQDASGPLRELSALRERVRTRFDAILMSRVRVTGLGRAEEVRVGQTIAAELDLEHPGIDAEDLEVEAVMSFRQRAQDRSKRVLVTLRSEGGENRSQWKGDFAAQVSGPHELRFRVRPRKRTESRPALGLHLQKWL